jgi:peptidyl-prolyl cis-trans isomerase B (cyclophilin B)
MKKQLLRLIIILSATTLFNACSVKKKAAVPAVEYDELVELKTDFGVITLKLYDETPLHKENFMNLVKSGFYDSLLFHRIIRGFMIQGGDPTSKYATPEMMLGGGGPNEYVPAEFRPHLFHKKGALAAARDGNPAKSSSRFQFYIVQGPGPIDSFQLQEMSMRTKFEYSDTMKKVYSQIGGTPHLDGSYTVFGEIVSGMEVLDLIASVPVGRADRPVTDLRMYMKVIRVPRVKK